MYETNTVESQSGQGADTQGETIESLRSLLDWLKGQFEGFGIDAGWAGLLVNVVGCLLIGILAGIGLKQLSEPFQHFAVIGVLGSLTTFSTFGHDTLELFQRQPLLALGNIAANVVIGLAAVALGYWLFHQS